MLVLSRKVGQAIHVGDDVTVTVIEIRENQVRLGIDAPDNVAVHRREVWLNINGGCDDGKAAVR